MKKVQAILVKQNSTLNFVNFHKRSNDLRDYFKRLLLVGFLPAESNVVPIR